MSLAYGLGPLIGGYVVEVVGFPNIMRGVGAMNVLYAPLLLLLKVYYSRNFEIVRKSANWPFLLLLKSSSVRSSAKEGELQNNATGDGEGLWHSSTGYGATC